MIWARLAPCPVADDGLGADPAAAPVDVGWEVAADEAFAHVEQRGIVTSVPETVAVVCSDHPATRA